MQLLIRILCWFCQDDMAGAIVETRKFPDGYISGCCSRCRKSANPAQREAWLDQTKPC